MSPSLTSGNNRNRHSRNPLRALAAVLGAAAITLTGCAGGDATSDGDSDAPLSVYATTGYLADAVATIDPTAEITTMVGPGGDPHTYQPSTKDIEKLRDSDLVFWNGLHLEAQMDDQLASLGDKQLAVGDQLPKDLLLDWPETDDEGNALHDPHVWNSPEAWSLVVDEVADKLAETVPDRADEFHANADKYKADIDAAVQRAHERLDDLPEPRVLITGHDAFNYFGRTFNLDIHATDFVSTEAKLSAAEISDLADLIAEKKVPAIFQDNQANPQAITSLKEAVHARGWDVRVSDRELFADSLGADAGVDTYLGAFNHNVDAVADELGAAR
ncbi:zinc ABC transporter substrate-binding protein [Corynebacterium frankenforstense]|uniref:metal ABC transporter substrate-binding protein n=1 Tax=Corynebacterium frankenforstense TaxID=1230998 RepID=UPI00254D7B73|nr:zinc ABC transporter substrate-binding protein [Corynebacterium frankenforstense]MDK6259875.1 zinc ABC transporter substrate-binding protein [Corynebacterium frankenforstense]